MSEDAATRGIGARLIPLGAGLLFATGLAVSGMTQPSKVIGFLDFFGAWDPSLIFVMAGAVGVYMLTYRGRVVKMTKPLMSARFALPSRSGIDLRLIAGAAIFGVGWGLSGFCPGPALVSLGGWTTPALWFVPATVLGMALFHRLFPETAGGDG